MPDHLRDRLQSSLGAAYTLERELGGGGMSRVYVARDEALGRAVVVKVLPPELAQGLSAERFSREIRLAATLQHANIVPVHLAGATADGLPYYMMPYVEGESLRHRLARGPVDIAEAVSILRDVARALAYAHARGVVHRDVKPDNILLSGGAAVVTDFGIAKAVSAARTSTRADSLTQAGVSLGTPAYMAPEQALADPTLDHRADLYSLGVVGYEVLAGTPPFTGETLQQLVAAHVGAVPAPVAQRRRDVPVALAALVTRLLAKDPAERPASADELIRLLDARTSHAGLAAPAVARAPDRRRLGRLLAGAAVVGLLASTLVWRLGRARPAVSDDPVPAAAAAVPPGSGVATVAVLYFENLSPDSSDAFLASGITEEVISRLGSIERVRVKGRNAVRALSPAVRDDYGALGRALGVGYVVEGSVRRAGQRLRVSVRLLTSENGFRVWGRDYDHAAGELLVVQDEIARDVAASLAGTLQPGERTRLAATGTRDPVAFEHYLRGNYHLEGRSPAAVRRAIAAYEAAVARDPRFTPAVARIAYAYAQFLDWGWVFPGLPPDSVLARGLSHADRALTQDPDAADAWLARGYLLSFRHPDSFEGVEEAFRRAIALRPDDAEAHHQHGWVLHELGRDADAVDAYQRALALEPHRASTLRGIGFVHLLANRDAAARSWLDSSTRVDPGFYSSYGLRGLAKLRLGDVAGARADGEMSLRLVPGDPLRGEFVIAMAHAAAGDSARARLLAARSAARVGPAAPAMWDAWYVALALVATGERDAAADVLARVRARERGLALRMALRARELSVVRSGAGRVARPRVERRG
jgi:serine/threonine-protein kinase